MNHVRACLYLWALFAAGTAWAKFDVNSDGCPGVHLTLCEAKHKICGAQVKCPRCDKHRECGVSGISTYKCQGCEGIHYVENQHTHNIAVCSSCTEKIREAVRKNLRTLSLYRSNTKNTVRDKTTKEEKN
ncbi:uncharacterized protein MELLADRAFT_124461 [Melampsora larici-populina 98AG31]|uniref:Secreted protein n=1 Tax=Melampsora larici-populina (strain 98AG31 / pathotype 3-4-7) TaxID=747676 RepID=F4SC49_MELLP|nr:uncharacterized protein MELLADRAFT_124461 [Melampsora larici-populina 98AG31]EGF97765.1 secreted protein [Melampsora larici-populina 98AG31]